MLEDVSTMAIKFRQYYNIFISNLTLLTLRAKHGGSARQIGYLNNKNVVGVATFFSNDWDYLSWTYLIKKNKYEKK